jgi:hypothetical protein
MIKKAKLISGSFKGNIVSVEGTDIERLGIPWFQYMPMPITMIYLNREKADQLPSTGKVYCCHHISGKKQGLSDFIHESELEFLEE